MSGVLQVWPHYEVKQTIRTMADIRSFFPSGKADELNWCFLSTSGVHGSYHTLDDMHVPDEEDGSFMRHITVLIVQPRLVVMRYGNVDVETDEDEAYLRKLVTSTIAAIRESQAGNLEKMEGQK